MSIDTAVRDFTEAKTFTVLGTPLLSEGRTNTLIALAPQLWLHAKVYGNGGERMFHAHPNEDHAFFVLAGGATFRTEEGDITEIGPYEGMMVPRGVRYAFESTGDECLVMLRIGAGEANYLDRKNHIAAQSATAIAEDLQHRETRNNVEIPDRVFTGTRQ